LGSALGSALASGLELELESASASALELELESASASVSPWVSASASRSALGSALEMMKVKVTALAPEKNPASAWDQRLHRRPYQSKLLVE
jgi:hypothetical protein